MGWFRWSDSAIPLGWGDRRCLWLTQQHSLCRHWLQWVLTSATIAPEWPHFRFRWMQWMVAMGEKSPPSIRQYFHIADLLDRVRLLASCHPEMLPQSRWTCYTQYKYIYLLLHYFLLQTWTSSNTDRTPLIINTVEMTLLLFYFKLFKLYTAHNIIDTQ